MTWSLQNNWCKYSTNFFFQTKTYNREDSIRGKYFAFALSSTSFVFVECATVRRNWYKRMGWGDIWKGGMRGDINGWGEGRYDWVGWGKLWMGGVRGYTNGWVRGNMKGRFKGWYGWVECWETWMGGVWGDKNGLSVGRYEWFDVGIHKWVS